MLKKVLLTTARVQPLGDTPGNNGSGICRGQSNKGEIVRNTQLFYAEWGRLDQYSSGVNENE